MRFTSTDTEKTCVYVSSYSAQTGKQHTNRYSKTIHLCVRVERQWWCIEELQEDLGGPTAQSANRRVEDQILGPYAALFQVKLTSSQVNPRLSSPKYRKKNRVN